MQNLCGYSKKVSNFEFQFVVFIYFIFNSFYFFLKMQALAEQLDAMMQKADRMQQFIQYLLKERESLQAQVLLLAQENAILTEEIENKTLENLPIEDTRKSAEVQEVKQKIDVYIQEIDGYLKKINDSVLT